MKTSFKKVLCLIVAACICFAGLPLMFAVTADNTEPQLSSRYETEIFLEGMATDFGTESYDLRSNTKKKFNSATDLSAVDEIELSVFVEDASSLSSFVNSGNSIALYFSSHSSRENRNCSYAAISSQIINDGWNTVRLYKSDFSEGVTWSGVRFIYIGFTNENATMPDGLKEKVFKYKNVCDLLVLPENNDGGVLIYEDAVINTLGENANSLVADTADRFADTFDTKDISKADIIKADFYISDYASFSSFLNQKEMKFTFVSEKGEKYTKSINTFALTANENWYTVQFAPGNMIASENFDESSVTGFKLEFIGEDNAVLGDSYSLKIAVYNIRGFEYKTEETNNLYGKKVSNIPGEKIVFITTKNYEGFKNSKWAEFAAIGDAKYLEFDLYVSDAENLKNAFVRDGNSNEINASWDLIFSSGDKTLIFKNIEKQVIANGWNHIILPIEDAQNNNFDLDFKFNKIEFKVSGINAETLNALSGNVIIADSFVSTKQNAAKNEIKFDKVSELSNGTSALIKDKFNNSNIKKDFSTADLKEAKYIEFDIYIQNFNELKTIIASKTISNIAFAINSASGSIEGGILGNITQDGWNHVTVPISKMLSNEQGSFDIEAVCGFEVKFIGETDKVTGLIEGQKISVLNIVATKVATPKINENAAVVLSEDGKSGVYGDTYSDIESKSEIKIKPAANISTASGIEFDFYVEDYESFKKMLEACGDSLYFALGTAETKGEADALYDFTSQVIDEGWNHIELQTLGYSKTRGSQKVNLETVNFAYLTFGDEVAANAYSKLLFKFINICVTVTAIDVVPEKPEYEIDILTEGFRTSWGDCYNYTADRLYSSVTPVDLSKMAQIEFDIYIEDYDAFINAVDGEALRVVLASGSTRFKNRAAYDLTKHIKQEGWNHVVINLSNYYLKESTNFESIKWISFAFWNGAGVANPIGTTVVRVANIGANLAEYDYLPELPENVIAQLGVAENDPEGSDNRGNTAGAYFHYTLDKIYREKLTPVDFSKSNIIEFDVYVNDYEKMLAADNDPTDKQNSKLSFVVSSTMPGLWEQYSKPRVYYSSEIDLAPYIKHSGWNHIKIGRSEFKTKNHGVDWSALTAFMIYYRNSSNLYPYKNQNSDLYIKVANIVNTGVVANIPVDKDCELQPDKNAVYISSVEGLSDEDGVWNIEDPIISTDYKTAGKASIQKKVNYNSELNQTSVSYIFDSTADMSDLKTLKFDFFIDLPQYLVKPTNKIEMIIGNNRFGKEDYYSFKLNISNMKQGWNKVSLNFKDAVKVGNPDLSTAKLIMLRFTEIDLSASEYEEIVYGIDNLRYISSTGSKTLNIAGKENGSDNDSSFDDGLLDNDTSSNDSDETEVVETIINKTGKTKVKKLTVKSYVTDFLTFGIIMGAQALILAVGVTLFIVIYLVTAKKKNR